MQWLEAALALSVIMMLFSTMVSAIVEVIQRTLSLRHKDLVTMIKHVYTQEVHPRIKDKSVESVTAFTDRLTNSLIGNNELHCSNTELCVASIQSNSAKRNSLFAWFADLFTFKQTSISLEEFVTRFAKTEAGAQTYEYAKQKGEEYLDIYLNDLASRYEEYGEQTRQYFQRRASFVSFVVSIAMALALNLNVVNVFNDLLTDKAMRQIIIDQGEHIAQRVNQRDPVSQEQLSPEQIKAQASANIQQYEQELKKYGIKVGWDEATSNALQNWKDWAMHLLFLFFSGCLIGLGGPFWFNIYKKLFAITSITRQVVSSIKDEKSTGEQAKKTELQIKERFIVALKAKGAV